jgi:hypothetical protein
MQPLHRQRIAFSVALLATALYSYLVSKGPRLSDNYDELNRLLASGTPKTQRRRLVNLAQFNDPATVEFKHPAHFSESRAYNLQSPSPHVVKPYNIDSVLLAIKAFRYQAFFFVYHSAKDEFVVIHNADGCDYGCARVYRIASTLSYALRQNFPQRFTGANSGDWIVILSTGDVPRLYIQCLGGNHCNSQDFAPVLQFGSMYDASFSILPSGIAMPMPVKPHLPCFESWQQSVFRDKSPGRVCGNLLPELTGKLAFSKTVGVQHGFIFAEDLSWDTLIPQIVWRGTDFVFLHTLFQGMRVPDYRKDVRPKIVMAKNKDEEAKAAIRAIWELGDEVLLPRWRGVLLTSEAELEANESAKLQPGATILPWINIKFASSAANSKKIPASQNPNLVRLQSVGITAIGDYISMQEQSHYKYHIDLGGGGGTTWTGTIEKLAMPGVLFHHVTPTVDYFYDKLVPWVHYIPIKADLSDLREKYEWAEAHQEETRKISAAGTEFAKWIGSIEGFRTMYQEYLVVPLKNCLDAYSPMDEERFGDKSVMDVIDEQGEDGWHVVAICSGLHADSCRDLNGASVN